MEWQSNVALAPLTTFKIGGVADFMCRVETEREVHDLCMAARAQNLPITILGGGSNVLISDAGIRGLVMHMAIGGISANKEGDSVVVSAGAGVSWDDLVLHSVSNGWWGIENLSGIPGTVGAAPVQNINAYGVALADHLYQVRAIHIPTGAGRIFTNEECRFGYRDSFFKTAKGREYVITNVVLQLSTLPSANTRYQSASQSIARYLKEGGEPRSPLAVRTAVIAIRKKIGMLTGMYQSAGSFFKNTVVDAVSFARVQEIVAKLHAEKGIRLAPWHWPLPDGAEKISTAFLLECTPYNKTDFAGKYFMDAVGISPLHSLSIINVGDATAEKVCAFAKCIIDAVEKEFGISIEMEVEMMGDVQ